jgi:hypothetical protein
VWCSRGRGYHRHSEMQIYFCTEEYSCIFPSYHYFFSFLTSFNLESSMGGNVRPMASTIPDVSWSPKCQYYLKLIRTRFRWDRPELCKYWNNCFSLAHTVIQVKIIGFFFNLERALNTLLSLSLFLVYNDDIRVLQLLKVILLDLEASQEHSCSHSCSTCSWKDSSIHVRRVSFVML